MLYVCIDHVELVYEVQQLTRRNELEGGIKINNDDDNNNNNNNNNLC